MKHIYTLLCMGLGVTLFAQVGIKTTTPTKTLDVDGDIYIRKAPQGDKGVDAILSTDADGNVRKLEISDLTSLVPELETAEFVSYVSGSNVTSDKTPTLDLWTTQENGGLESVKRYYFLGQEQRITLPKNVTSEGDGRTRKITFVLIESESFGGTATSDWNLVFQTKLFQEETDTFNGGNGGVCLVDFTPDSGTETSLLGTGSFTEEGSVGCYRRSVTFSSGSANIGDREVTFYDFGGKWFMPLND